MRKFSANGKNVNLRLKSIYAKREVANYTVMFAERKAMPLHYRRNHCSSSRTISKDLQ